MRVHEKWIGILGKNKVGDDIVRGGAWSSYIGEVPQQLAEVPQQLDFNNPFFLTTWIVLLARTFFVLLLLLFFFFFFFVVFVLYIIMVMSSPSFIWVFVYFLVNSKNDGSFLTFCVCYQSTRSDS